MRGLRVPLHLISLYLLPPIARQLQQQQYSQGQRYSQYLQTLQINKNILERLMGIINNCEELIKHLYHKHLLENLPPPAFGVIALQRPAAAGGLDRLAAAAAHRAPPLPPRLPSRGGIPLQINH